ncbi:MAG: hypothetical protein IT223_06295 [Crocinitomicaceae bacterium]|nr:hypothetical protein [Crocinitomicaceae bacterium]
MKQILCVLFLSILSFTLPAQTTGVSVNTDGTPPDASAIFDINSSSQGLLIPRMTTAEIGAIISPAPGLLVFNTTTYCFNVYKTTGWYEWCGECIAPAPPVADNSGPVCEGGTLSLTASTVPGATYSWTGPDGFVSSLQNPSISNVTSTASGAYLVSSLSNGCASTPSSTLVTINPLPIAPSSGTHVPSENQIVWNWNNVAGATAYYWNTVNNFSSATNIGQNTSYTQTGLICNSSYTLYVWCTTACGDSSPLTLSQSTSACPGACGGQTSLTDSRDSQVYPIVSIGMQCWMAANLNFGTTLGISSTQSNNGTVEKFCYADVASNCTTYGGLYQWAESVGYASTTNNVPSGVQGVCPSGWHVPSDAEWKILETSIGMSPSEVNGGEWRGSLGGELKSTSGLWTAPNVNATNSVGFNALPGGQCTGGSCGSLGTIARFNTATSQQTYGYADSSQRIERRLQNDSNQIYRPTENTGCCSSNRAFSVRCVKN